MSEDWKNKDIPPYLKGKPANWSDSDNDWSAFKGNEKLEKELASIKQKQTEILERLDKPIDTQVTGSTVEEIFNATDVRGGDYVGFYGDNETYGATGNSLKPIDVSGFRRISLQIENNYEAVFGGFYIITFPSLEEVGIRYSQVVSGNYLKRFKISAGSIGTGQKIIVNSSTDKDLGGLYKGIIVAGFTEPKEDDDREGVTLRILGGR